MGAMVAVDELVEATAGGATAVDFFDFLVLLTGLAPVGRSVSSLGVLRGDAMKVSRRRVAPFRLRSKGGGRCESCQLDDVPFGVISEEGGRASERELLTAVPGVLCSKDVVDR